MGKGRGKKGRRGGKAGGGGVTSAGDHVAVAAVGPAEPAAVATIPAAPASSSSPVAPAAAPFPGALFFRQEWVRALGLRLGIYALFFLGAYWILAALFSTWGFSLWDYPYAGRSIIGGFWWLLVGAGLLFTGWYLSSPDAPATEEKPATDAERKAKNEEQLKLGQENMRIGLWWAAGGAALAMFGAGLLGTPMATYIGWGAVAYGAIQVLQGYFQMTGATKEK